MHQLRPLLRMQVAKLIVDLVAHASLSARNISLGVVERRAGGAGALAAAI